MPYLDSLNQPDYVEIKVFFIAKNAKRAKNAKGIARIWPDISILAGFKSKV